MKKIYFFFYVLAFLFSPIYQAKGQSVVNYVLSASASSYTPISGGVPISISGNLNDGYANNIPIGFVFVYNSQSYTSISVSTNGFISLGGTISNPANGTNNLSTGGGTISPRPIIAPLWDNLNFNLNSDLSYQTIGNAPNRTFIMQWQNARWGSLAINPGISFQVRLFEADSKIEFIYRNESGTLNAPSASIGITNNNSGTKNFLCLTSTSNNSSDTSTIIETTTLNTKPSSGQSYTFAPKFQVPTIPSVLTYTNITGTQLTLNWNDSSNSETYFLVYMSSDDINYNLISTINSINSAGTGTSYQQNFSGLVPGNRYYFRVYACNEGSLPVNYTQGNVTTAAGLLSGVKQICPSLCDYTSIGAACNDIRAKGVDGSLVLELMNTYSPSVESYPLIFGNLLSNNTNTITIKPHSAVVNPIIFTSNATSTFAFNQTNYLTIDGQKNGQTASEFIQIFNSNSSGSAISFINGSSNNTITNCRILGTTQSNNSGVISFLGSSMTTGNNYNSIFNNSIKDSINTPMNCIYSGGNTNAPNLYNSIYNNNIYNYHNASNPSYGIFIGSGSNAWFISNNSFYQTSIRNISFTYAGAMHLANGSNYTVIGNYIGGSAPSCGGAASQYTGNGFVNLIRLNLSASNTNVLLGNYVQNINLNWSGSSGINSLIHLINGAFNISGNQLGSETESLKITVNNTTGTIDFAAIYLGGGSSYDETQINYNSISGFNIGSSGLGNIQFAGIRIANTVPALQINDNTIGSATQSNNIHNQSKAYTYGIIGPAGSSQNTITGNLIANMHANNTDSNANVCGIFINSSGSFTVSRNTIFKLFSKSVLAQNAYNSPTVGIWHASSGPDQICSFNTIHNLYATNNSNPNMNNVFGIRYINSASGTNVLANNFVHTLGSSATIGATIYGIQNANQFCISTNNMIRLGIDSNGNNMIGNHSFIGIHDYNSTNSNSYYHNSIYIGGQNLGPNNLNSYAFFNSDVASGTRNIINNIFYNARSNVSGTGKQYAICFALFNINGLTLDHNIYYAPNSGGNFGRINVTDYTNIHAWRSQTFMDFNTGIGDPNFVNPNGNSNNLSLKLQSNSAAEGSGMEIPEVETDYEGEIRQNNTPNDIGADAGNYTKIDIFAPYIDYQPLSNTTSISNRTVVAKIKDAGVGVNTNVVWRPRIYFRRILPTVSAWQTTQGTQTSGTSKDGTWSFSIDYSLTGTPVLNGHRYQYYIVAQDSANPTNVFFNPFAGGNHATVNSMITAPTNAYTYSIVNGLATNLFVGTGQTYTNLTGPSGLFAAINNGVLTGNTTATILTNTTEPGTIALNNVGLNGFNLLIKPTNSPILVSGNANTGVLAMIAIDGAEGVCIDGGSNRLLTFRNSIGTIPNAGTASTIRIRNGYRDTIKNCIIEGNSANSSIGTVNFGTSSVAQSSESIVLNNNQIRPPLNDSTNAPNSPVVINSAAGNISNCRISANQIIDFNTFGIYIQNAGRNIIIGDSMDAGSGNHLIQRRARTAMQYPIMVGSGNGNTIGNNKIYNLHNITHSGGIYGIYVYNGINNTLITKNSIGGSNENRGGDPMRMSNIFTGIIINGGNLQHTRIEQNRIGNILLNGTSGTFTGIYGIGGKLMINNNLIGVDKNNSIASDSISISQSFYGIRYNSSSTVNISNNQIRNLYNNGIGFSVGISIDNGIFQINNNDISHLYTKATTNNSVDYSCVGIRISSARTDNNIENNNISDLHNLSNFISSSVTGIAVMNTIKTSMIQRNRIYNLFSTNTGLTTTSPIIRGIFVGSNGSSIYHNNQISLAQEIANTQPRIRGIDISSSGGTNQFYYNTIYIGGVNAGDNNSSAFFRNVSSSTAAVELVNNILYNERMGAGTHYSLSSNFSGNFIQDNNLFVARAVGSIIEFPLGTSRTLATWNSFTGNPIYNILNTNTELLADSFFENKNMGNLKSTSCRIADIGAYVSVQNDFQNQLRGIPSDIGSTEFTLSNDRPSITQQAINDTIFCNGGNAHFKILARASGIKYQWQLKQGSTWQNLTDNLSYIGTNTDSLRIINPNSLFNNNQYRCVVSGACNPADTSIARTLIVVSNNYWTGATGTNWNNAANWSCGILPTASTDAIINNVSNLPVISDSVQQCYKLSIAAGASVTLNNAASKLAIFGPIELNGNIIHSNGTISFSGNVTQNIPPIAFHKLEINNSSGVQLGGHISVANQLHFIQGTIQLNQYHLSLLGNNSQIFGANSANKFIVSNDTGSLIIQHIGTGNRLGSVLFPIGSNPNSYTPLSLLNAGVSDHFKARVMPQVYNQYQSNGNPLGAAYTANAVNKTWVLHELVSGGSNAQVQFSWNINDELFTFNRSASYVAQYSGTQWTGNTPTAAGGINPYFQSISGVTQFTIFGVASGGLLPIKLLSFEANQENRLVQLNWKTLSEKNSKIFQVERSTDGILFTKIGEVKAAGNSEVLKTYGFTDTDLPQHTNWYYRLRLVDRDDTYSFSKVIQLQSIASNQIHVFPNPFCKEIYIDPKELENTEVLITLSHINGNTVLQKKMLLQGLQQINDIAQLVPGIYILSIQSQNYATQIKLIKE